MTVAPPVRQTATDYLEVTGSVVATDTVEIRARVQGFLQRMEFTAGEIVEEGDLLYVIDPRKFQSKLEQAEAAERTTCSPSSKVGHSGALG